MDIQTITLVFIALIISFLIAYYLYYYKVKNTRRISLLLCAIRTTVFFMLFLLLINPRMSKVDRINEKPKLSVLVDNSSSILFFKKDLLVDSLLSNFKSNKRLNKKFDITYFSFGNQFRVNDRFTFQEHLTDLSKPLEILKESQDDNNAIVLVSDGNQTYGNSYEYSTIKTPVFPIVIGDTTKYEDVQITQLNVNRYSYINNQFPVEVFLEYSGYNNVTPKFTIKNNNKIIFSKKVNFTELKNSISLQTFIKSVKVGLNTYTANIEYLKNEKNKKNNQKDFSLEVIDKQSDILIASSLLHPDLGALKKSIESDKQRNVTIKIIDQESIDINDYELIICYQPKESFTPLFDEIKRKKIPYFLITGPKSDWSFINSLSIGIQKNFINKTENYSSRFNTNYLNFSQDNIGFKDFPPLVDNYGEIMITIPHKTLLFQTINGISTQNPLLLSSDDNNQKRVFLLGEGFWKWRSNSYLFNKSFKPFDTFIGNLIQYTSSTKNTNRLDVDIKRVYNSNSIINISAFYVDKNYQFDQRANLLFTLIHKQTNEKIFLPFSLVGNSYQIEFSSLKSGIYEYNTTVENQNISVKGVFEVLDFQAEEQFTNANIDKLEKLSRRSKGKLFFEDQDQQLMDELLNDNRFVTIQKFISNNIELINLNWILLLIISLLSVEWFVRKYFGKI